MARSRARARLNWVSHGQRWARCRVRRRAERVSRPAREKKRHRRVLVVTTWSPSPMRPVQEKGKLPSRPPRHAEGVGPHRVERAVVPEEPGGPPGRVELGGLPTLGAALTGQSRQEPVHRLGVLQIAQQLDAAGAGQVAPGQGRCRVQGRNAPPPPGRAHGGAVPSGQQSQPAVGEGQQAAALHHQAGGQVQSPQPFQGLEAPGLLHPQQLPQVGRGQTGPIEEQVQGALPGGLEHRGQQEVGRVLPGRVRVQVQVRGGGLPAGRSLAGQFPARPHVVQDFPQAQRNRAGGRAPYRGTGSGASPVALQGQEGPHGQEV